MNKPTGDLTSRTEALRSLTALARKEDGGALIIRALAAKSAEAALEVIDNWPRPTECAEADVFDLRIELVRRKIADTAGIETRRGDFSQTFSCVGSSAFIRPAHPPAAATGAPISAQEVMAAALPIATTQAGERPISAIRAAALSALDIQVKDPRVYGFGPRPPMAVAKNDADKALLNKFSAEDLARYADLDFLRFMIQSPDNIDVDLMVGVKQTYYDPLTTEITEIETLTEALNIRSQKGKLATKKEKQALKNRLWPDA